MKTKVYIYLTNAEGVLNGDNPHFHGDSYGELSIEGWVLTGEAEVEVSLNMDNIRDSVVTLIDTEETNLRAALYAVEVRRQNLLAIEHKGDQ